MPHTSSASSNELLCEHDTNYDTFRFRGVGQAKQGVIDFDIYETRGETAEGLSALCTCGLASALPPSAFYLLRCAGATFAAFSACLVFAQACVLEEDFSARRRVEGFGTSHGAPRQPGCGGRTHCSLYCQ